MNTRETHAFCMIFARNSRMSVCFLTRTTCKNVLQKSHTSGHCLQCLRVTVAIGRHHRACPSPAPVVAVAELLDDDNPERVPPPAAAAAAQTGPAMGMLDDGKSTPLRGSVCNDGNRAQT